MTPVEVITLVVAIAKAFGLAVEDVVSFAKQKEPRLRTEPIPDEGAEMDKAREAALRGK